MAIIRIDDPEDPRVAAFRDIRERDLTGRDGRFVAEGRVVLNVLSSPQSLCRPVSLLLAGNRVEGMADVLARLDAEVPVYVAGQAVLDRVAGFPLHRGILALGEKPTPVDAATLLAGLPERAVVVAACGIGNHDNMGGIFRAAAAFGAGAVLLDQGCCDPFYRKAIRVSVGAVLRTPMATGLEPMAMLDALERAAFEAVAMTPSATETLERIRPGRRTAIVLGADGPGLPEGVIARCRAAAIRMAGGFDSLNVATAGAIALHHFAQQA